jgi:hypothetical protein
MLQKCLHPLCYSLVVRQVKRFWIPFQALVVHFDRAIEEPRCFCGIAGSPLARGLLEVVGGFEEVILGLGLRLGLGFRLWLEEVSRFGWHCGEM